MKLICTIILSLVVSGNLALAQSNVKGKVMEQHTDIKLSGITVENQTQHVRSQTDPFGNFSIKAKKGDLLCFYGLNYIPDTIYLTATKSLVIYLVLRSNQLKEVQVTQQGVNSSGWTSPAEKGVLGSKTVFYQPGGGLKVKLFTGNPNEKKRKKLADLERQGEQELQIARVFSPANLKNYVPFAGQELSNFIIKYRPSIGVYYNEKFNLVDYINSNYKAFITIPAEQRKSPTYFQLNK